MEAFLYLLTQQLKYQDPLDPMDTSEYTNQLVQYAQVEQSIQSNEYLETIVAQNVNAMATQAISYMDQTVQALSDYLPLQDGYAKFPIFWERTPRLASLRSEIRQVITLKHSQASNNPPAVTNWNGTAKTTTATNWKTAPMFWSLPRLTRQDQRLKSKNRFGKVTGVAYDGDVVAVGMGEVAVDMNSVLAVHDKSELTPPPAENPGDTDEDAGSGDSDGSGDAGDSDDSAEQARL